MWGKNIKFLNNQHHVEDKLVYNICKVRAKLWGQILLSANHDYEAAADDDNLSVFNPNRFSNNFGAIGGILAGSGAIKFTIFSWTLYLSSNHSKNYSVHKWLQYIYTHTYTQQKRGKNSNLSIPYLPTFWGTTINNFSFLWLHSLQSIKCFLCRDKLVENEKKWTFTLKKGAISYF